MNNNYNFKFLFGVASIKILEENDIEHDLTIAYTGIDCININSFNNCKYDWPLFDFRINFHYLTDRIKFFICSL
jgi:hypothetical protein